MAKIELAYAFREEIKELFQEYTNLLVAEEPQIAGYLSLQNYDAELEHLEHKYGLPDGRLYIARIGDQAAGCSGFRKLDDVCCELKRLYVRPDFRGHKLGEKLLNKCIEEARTEGYHFIYLDTMPFLDSAIRLYQRFGFYEIEAYNDSPVTSTIFMRLDLQG